MFQYRLANNLKNRTISFPSISNANTSVDTLKILTSIKTQIDCREEMTVSETYKKVENHCLRPSQSNILRDLVAVDAKAYYSPLLEARIRSKGLRRAL